MKKTIASLFTLSASVLGVFAQSTFTASNSYVPTVAANGSDHNVLGLVNTKAYLYDTDGTKLSTAFGRFELLDSTGNVLSPVKDGTGDHLQLGGIFSISPDPITVPGTSPGSPTTATITIRAWDSSTGSTYGQATEKGETTFFMNALGGGNGGLVLPTSMQASSNFLGLELTGTTVIPEPSTVALAALGMAGLFFVARRK